MQRETSNEEGGYYENITAGFRLKNRIQGTSFAKPNENEVRVQRTRQERREDVLDCLSQFKKQQIRRSFNSIQRNILATQVLNV